MYKEFWGSMIHSRRLGKVMLWTGTYAKCVSVCDADR